METANRDPIFIITSDAQVNLLMEQVLQSSDYTTQVMTHRSAVEKALEEISPLLVVMGETLADGSGLDYAAALAGRYPALPILLFVYHESAGLLKQALHAGVSDTLCFPLKAEDILKAVAGCLEQAGLRKAWVKRESTKDTASLRSQLDDLETLGRLGKSINRTLDLDSVLTAVVDAAVKLTGAEEGSLLLVDEASGDLYMRAARNFNEEFVRTFRLPINDTLAGSVVKTGKPVIFDESRLQKIKTSYLVRSLVYVPLQLQERVIGVLGVDNRQERGPFKEYHIKLLSAVADYAVIAIENARLYAHTSTERVKLETILTKTRDGVIVIDQEQRLALVNQAARAVFCLGESAVEGRPFAEVFRQPELLELVQDSSKTSPNRVEITVSDGRVFDALVTPIPEVGLAITMHDINELKELDRIKSDFVNTVSHDLRSPLTAILGYVDLIERVGPVSAFQRDFIRRIQISVNNITNLVDDLLNLGRIEAGFDTRREDLRVDEMIRDAAEIFNNKITAKNHTLTLDLPEMMPPVPGNPVQIRQVVDNLLENAIKYSPPGGSLVVEAGVESSQVILQFRDSGVGIPAVDLPYIFDKFYRASNVSNDTEGTGLGLAIVKSIVDSHLGRIWVESKPGEGSVFTVVLPLAAGA